jgi:hypothetical protein
MSGMELPEIYQRNVTRSLKLKRSGLQALRWRAINKKNNCGYCTEAQSFNCLTLIEDDQGGAGN